MDVGSCAVQSFSDVTVFSVEIGTGVEDALWIKYGWFCYYCYEISYMQ